jgi:hypothetical protein
MFRNDGTQDGDRHFRVAAGLGFQTHSPKSFYNALFVFGGRMSLGLIAAAFTCKSSSPAAGIGMGTSSIRKLSKLPV